MKHSLQNKRLAWVLALLLIVGVLPIGALASSGEVAAGAALIEAEVVSDVETEVETEAETEAEPETESETAAETSAEAEEPASGEAAEAADGTSAEPVVLALDGEGEEPAAAASVTVTFAASESYFIVAPTTLTVKDGLAEEYGYANDASVTAPTFLDALVAAHSQMYGDAFRDAPTDYLVCDSTYGSLSKVFGIESYNIACLVNGRMPGNGALMANQATLQTGDTVQLLIYQYFSMDYTTWATDCDWYACFAESTMTVEADEPFTLTLKGHALADEMWGYAVTDAPLAGAYVSVCPIGADGHLGAQIAEATADENGQITLSIASAGAYRITVSGMTEDGMPLSLPWCNVTVGKAASLAFFSGTGSTAMEYELTSAFSSFVSDYTVTVPDNTATLCVKATPVQGTASVAYTKTTGAEYAANLTSGKTTSLSQAVKTGVSDGNVITITMDGTDYRITVVREATLSKLTLASGGETLALTPAFKATDNTQRAFELVFGGSELTVTPTAKVAANVVTVDGRTLTDGAAVVSPVWEGHEYSFDIVLGGGAGKYTIRLLQIPTALTVQTMPAKCEYLVGDTLDLSGLTLTASYADGSEETIGADALTLVSGATVAFDETLVVSYRGVTVEQAITIADKLPGAGTEADPYLLATAADLARVSAMTAAGESFAGKHFAFANDITLPDAWTPIGQKGAYFSGSIDGKNHLLTIPAGSQTMIGAPLGAVLKNLNIYGESIDGNGVVAIYTTGKTTDAIEIANVTLKSGSHTTGAGFVGGYASGTYKVYIHDCAVESGVVIGDGTASNIGSFGGDFNGTIENCTSDATVKGVNYVGGISGSKGQSMGDYKIIGCTFGGEVIATGNYVGGISGGGYAGTGAESWGGIASAPNTACVTIQNCRVTGTIRGADYVGGILGAEAGVVQCWENGTGYIQNNRFTGTIVSDGQYVGGVIGYMNSLNKYTVIENNIYLCTGADRGIGGAKYVDTSFENPTAVQGVTYVNSEGQKPSVTGMSKKDCNRTDDPLGADADKLATSNVPSAAVEKLIDAIGEVTAESKAAIEAARAAYDALSAEEKTLVRNYALLTAAERRLAALDPQGGTAVIGTGSTKLVLDGVTYMVDAEAASLMQRIANLRDAGSTDDEAILEAWRTYDAMSRELKAQVFNFADLEALCQSLGVRGHRDGQSGFAAEGLPWYVGLEITAITGGADYETVARSIGRNELLALWNIAFVNRLTGEPFTPYDTVTLRVAVPEMGEALESFRMALYSLGRVEYADCTVENGELCFAVTEGGVYGFIGGAAAATQTLLEEAPAEEPVEEAVAEVEMPETEIAEVPAQPEPESAHTLLWLWIAIGIAGVGILVVVVVMKQKERKAKHAVK